MPVPVTTEKPSTSETAVTDVDNSGNIAAQQAQLGFSDEQKKQQQQQQQQGADEGKKTKEEADELYEERIEEEYAKREGGA